MTEKLQVDRQFVEAIILQLRDAAEEIAALRPEDSDEAYLAETVQQIADGLECEILWSQPSRCVRANASEQPALIPHTSNKRQCIQHNRR